MLKYIAKMLNTRVVNALIERKDIVRFPINRNDRVGILHKSWGMVFTNLLEGAYYEFGIYEGATFVDSWKVYLQFKKWAASQLESQETWRRELMKEYVDFEHDFYGYDTFEGMPTNDEGNRIFAQGTFFASFDEVDRKCRSAGMRYRLFKGLFSDIPDEVFAKLQSAAIVNIDSDLYLSARDALEKVKEKLQQGTIILMDDYNCFCSSDTKGERRALKEFTEKYSYIKLEPWHAYQHVGQSFICHIHEKTVTNQDY